jgi:hypothetical protein
MEKKMYEFDFEGKKYSLPMAEHPTAVMLPNGHKIVLSIEQSSVYDWLFSMKKIYEELVDKVAIKKSIGFGSSFDTDNLLFALIGSRYQMFSKYFNDTWPELAEDIRIIPLN